MIHRLKPEVVIAVVDSVRAAIPAERLEGIFLFGSRADVNAKGGDIDLWILCDQEALIDLAWARKVRGAIQDQLGEQKVDILISGPLDQVTELRKKAFLERIESKKVELWRRNPQR